MPSVGKIYIYVISFRSPERVSLGSGICILNNCVGGRCGGVNACYLGGL